MKKKLLIDAGNSSLKWALLEVHPPTFTRYSLSKMQSVVYAEKYPENVFKDILLMQQTSEIDTVVMVSVLGDDFSRSSIDCCAQYSLELTLVKSAAQLAGITVAYSEPQKLGTDRLVAMIAAHHLVNGQACIVVDAGTATTIDAVDTQGQHLGGVILSGLDLCSQSLLKNTELLASHSSGSLDKNGKQFFEPKLFSSDTKQAINSGSLFGLAGAIDTICFNMEEEIQNKSMDSITIKKFICGGSANEMIPYLKTDFIFAEDLVMQGLKIISTIVLTAKQSS
ncbi:MAG: type III pantothenate kinase [Cocleimonas sp.]|nr:type III pantothenate kinase [Cocleimonas sp.]